MDARSLLDHPRSHEQAEEIFHRMQAFPELPEFDSRLVELVEFFGWEIGHKAPFCRPWLWHDDPRRHRLAANLDVTVEQWEVMHQYALYHRMSPASEDVFWIFDGLLDWLDSLGGPERLSVLDFGCGIGQIGLAFKLAGYRVVLNDVAAHQLEFARFLHESRGLSPEIWQSPTRSDYFDTARDGRPFGLVVEWSVFEHIGAGVDALRAITGGLVENGLFVTTTFAKEWTPELIEHYRRDAGHFAEELFSGEAEAFLRDRFEVLSPPKSLAKVLVKRA